jgi:vacuolar protein sorting-associated protein 1
MPGFPSINSFYYLIDPLLRRLKLPLMHCLSEVARLLSHVCEEIIRELAREFPTFCDFILDKLSRLIEASRKKSETFIENILECELGYIYTNNMDFQELLREKP